MKAMLTGALVAVLGMGPVAASTLLTFGQANLDYRGGGGVPGVGVPLSDWGVLEVSALGSAAPSYVNLVVDGEWRIQNMPFQSFGGAGAMASNSYAFSLGNAPGQAVAQVNYGFSLSAGPLAAAPGMDSVARVLPLDMVMGPAIGDGAFQYVGLPMAMKGDEVEKEAKIEKFEQQQCGSMLCAPAGVSNGLKWLNGKYDLKMDKDDISLEALQKGLKVNPPNGAAINWGKDKAAYLKDKKLPVESFVLEDWSKVLDLMDKGAAVELSVFDRREVMMGKRKVVQRIGHVASVVGLTKFKDGRFSVTVAHDTDQNDPKKGLKEQTGIYDPKKANITNIWGMDMPSPDKIFFVVQRPVKMAPPPPVPEPATWAMLIAGFGMVGFAMRRREAVVRVMA